MMCFIQGTKGYSMPMYDVKPFPIWGLTAIITFQVLRSLVPAKHYRNIVHYLTLQRQIDRQIIHYCIINNDSCTSQIVFFSSLLLIYYHRKKNKDLFTKRQRKRKKYSNKVKESNSNREKRAIKIKNRGIKEIKDINDKREHRAKTKSNSKREKRAISRAKREQEQEKK